MPAPSSPTYSAAAKVAAHTSFRDLLDSGSGAGSAKVRDASDVLLVTIPLDDPSGTINGTTGQLTLDFPAAANAAASGTAAYAELCDRAAVSGKFVLNTLAIVSGSPVEVVSATIG